MPGDSPGLQSLLRHQTGHVRNTASQDGDADEYLPFALGRIGTRPRMMVAFVAASGQVDVFPYASLSRIKSENRETAMELQFGQVRVEIEGRGLEELFRYLCEQRAAEIREADRAAQLAAQPKDALVKRLIIHTLSPL